METSIETGQIQGADFRKSCFHGKAGRIKLYGFTIMINHIHLVWHIQPAHKREDVQRDFLKYTAQQIKADLEKNHRAVLAHFLMNAKDRKYQVWERNPLSVDIWRREVMFQKLSYMHLNPVRARVCNTLSNIIGHRRCFVVGAAATQGL